MSTDYTYAPEPALVKGDHSFGSITELIAKTPLNPTPKLWYLAFGVSNILLITLLGAVGYLVWDGIGIWGLNNPAGWGWATPRRRHFAVNAPMNCS